MGFESLISNLQVGFTNVVQIISMSASYLSTSLLPYNLLTITRIPALPTPLIGSNESTYLLIYSIKTYHVVFLALYMFISKKGNRLSCFYPSSSTTSFLEPLGRGKMLANSSSCRWKEKWLMLNKTATKVISLGI